MNWTEAQKYCRENYTDLATIENTEEMNRLINTVVLNVRNSWIGLYTNINWTWSDGYRGTGAEYRNWAPTEPNFYAGDQLCVRTNKGGKWSDVSCSFTLPFICSRGKGITMCFDLEKYEFEIQYVNSTGLGGLV